MNEENEYGQHWLIALPKWLRENGFRPCLNSDGQIEYRRVEEKTEENAGACNCTKMICNSCGCEIVRDSKEVGGNGEYETFWYETNGGLKHTHQCLSCQMGKEN